MKNTMRNSGYWWMNLGGGWLDSPEILSEIRSVESFRHQLMEQEARPVAEVLMVTDDRSFLYARPHGDLHCALIKNTPAEILLCGAPVDHYRFRDLFELDLSRWKCIFFLNALIPEGGFRDCPVLRREDAGNAYPYFILREDASLRILGRLDNGDAGIRETWHDGRRNLYISLPFCTWLYSRRIMEEIGILFYAPPETTEYADSRFIGLFPRKDVRCPASLSLWQGDCLRRRMLRNAPDRGKGGPGISPRRLSICSGVRFRMVRRPRCILGRDTVHRTPPVAPGVDCHCMKPEGQQVFPDFRLQAEDPPQLNSLHLDGGVPSGKTPHPDVRHMEAFRKEAFRFHDPLDFLFIERCAAGKAGCRAGGRRHHPAGDSKTACDQADPAFPESGFQKGMSDSEFRRGFHAGTPVGVVIGVGSVAESGEARLAQGAERFGHQKLFAVIAAHGVICPDRRIGQNVDMHDFERNGPGFRNFPHERAFPTGDKRRGYMDQEHFPGFEMFCCENRERRAVRSS